MGSFSLGEIASDIAGTVWPERRSPLRGFAVAARVFRRGEFPRIARQILASQEASYRLDHSGEV
jgi:hypothetical protein